MLSIHVGLEVSRVYKLKACSRGTVSASACNNMCMSLSPIHRIYLSVSKYILFIKRLSEPGFQSAIQLKTIR